MLMVKNVRWAALRGGANAVLCAGRFVGGHECGVATHVLADRDELHLGRDDAAAGVMKLGDVLTWLGAERAALQAGKNVQLTAAIGLGGILGVTFGEITIIFGSHGAAGVFLDI